ncbi:MAG: 1,4-dihydroxy-2-naphthoate octaprenyltransferase [Polyangiaceae bacterium]
MTFVGALALATRPKTLLLAVAPVAVAAGILTTCPPGSVRWIAIAFALAGAVFLQIGTNLANDVFDAEKGADGSRKAPADVRVVASGLLGATTVASPWSWRSRVRLSWACASRRGEDPGIVAIGVASILSGILYTGGPWPLGYNGLGDVFVFVFFGPVAVLGTLVVCGATPGPWSFVAAIPVGVLATLVLVLNNVRDVEGDRKAAKRTLVVRFGRRFGLAEFDVGLAVAYAIPVALALASRHGILDLALLLPVATLPFALGLRTEVRKAEGRGFNELLSRTARLALVHATCLAAGIAVSSTSLPFVRP